MTTHIDPKEVMVELDKFRLRLESGDADTEVTDQIHAMINAISENLELGQMFLQFWNTMGGLYRDATARTEFLLRTYGRSVEHAGMAALESTGLAATMALTFVNIGYAIRERQELERIMDLMPNMVQGNSEGDDPV